jgi:hypothetical protein
MLEKSLLESDPEVAEIMVGFFLLGLCWLRIVLTRCRL